MKNILAVVLCMAWVSVNSVSPASAADNALAVFKNPGCGCCSKWADQVEAAGFRVDVVERSEANLKQWNFGLQARLRSCHSAVYDGKYIFEGHVPVNLVERFLQDPPDDAIGLSVPGMPAGSPGMEAGGRIDPYDVLLLKTDGTVEVYEHIEGA
jgi:hypothetical protein